MFSRLLDIFITICPTNKFTVAVFSVFLMFMMITSYAQQPTSTNSTSDFFRIIVGEWIGMCDQSTDGVKADDKYFHALVKQVNANTFSAAFDYYRIDKRTNTPLRIGSTTFTTTIETDGAAKNKITGKGIMLVNNKPKNQQHELQEILTSPKAGNLQGHGAGKISVNGMPFGLGKNGKIADSKSSWSLNNDVLTIHQTISAGFRALFFKKTFKISANYTARRGSNVASLWSNQTRSASKPDDYNQ